METFSIQLNGEVHKCFSVLRLFIHYTLQSREDCNKMGSLGYFRKQGTLMNEARNL